MAVNNRRADYSIYPELVVKQNLNLKKDHVITIRMENRFVVGIWKPPSWSKFRYHSLLLSVFSVLSAEKQGIYPEKSNEFKHLQIIVPVISGCSNISGKELRLY